MSDNLRLRIAIQKKGRLHQDSIALLLQCGLKMHFNDNALFYHCENLPIDILFMRDDDIPTLVEDGICDLGIVGENILKEHTAALSKYTAADYPIEIIKHLGFSFCKLAIALPQECIFQSPQDLQGLRIATTYPNLLKAYLSEQEIKADILTISGSVEIAPRLGMADAICDLVATGRTLEENHLKQVLTILMSQAVFIRNNRPFNLEKQNTYDLLLRRMNGVATAQESKYIMFHAPRSALPAIKALLPGSEAPTILPLNGEDNKVAVHVVSREAVFWNTLEQLKQAGASAILVLPIEKMLI